MRIILAALVMALVATPAAANPAGLIITAFGISAGSVAAAFIQIGVGLALSALSSALTAANRNDGPRGIRLQSLTSGDQTPQSFILGTYISAGNLTAPEMSHGNDGDTRYLTRVVDFSDIQITGLSGLIIDGVACQLATGNPATLTMTANDGTTPAIHPLYGPTVNKGDFIGHAWCRFYDGSQTAADPMLLSIYGSYPQRPWTAQMIGRGVAYAALTFLWRDTPQVWQGRPDVKFILQGIRLYDPRKDTTAGGSGLHRYGNTGTHEFSDNPVVMIYNLMRGIQILGGDVYGGGYAAADLPYSVWAAAMNACDVMVGSRKTYTAGFEVFMGGSDAGGMSPADVVEELLKACSGQIADVGGTIYIRVGAPGLPIKFITDDDIIVSQPQRLDPFPGANESYNIVHATWVNPAKLWTVAEATSRRDETAITADGQDLVAPLALGSVTSGGQVQQLTAAWLKDSRRFRRHNITLPPEGILLKPLDVIEWTSAREGYATKLFEIGEMGIDSQSLSTTISIREVNPNDYNWSVGDELAESAVSIERVLPSAQQVPGWTVISTSIPNAAGTARRPALRFVWSTPLPRVTAISIQVRIQATGTVIFRGSTSDIADGEHWLTSGILHNTNYEARARLVGPRQTEWTAWTASGSTPQVRFNTDDIDEGAVTADRLNVASITNSGLSVFGGALQSDNYVAGVSGWRIGKTGSAQFQNLIVRGSLTEGAATDTFQEFDANTVSLTTSNTFPIVLTLGTQPHGAIFKRAMSFEARAAGGGNTIIELQTRSIEFAGDPWSSWITVQSWTISSANWGIYKDTGNLTGAFDNFQYRLACRITVASAQGVLRRCYLTVDRNAR